MTKYSDKAEAIKEVLDAAYGGNSPGTFTELQTLITNTSSGDTIVLDKDYKYDSTTDSSLTNGITISKNITIIGNGHIIDGNNTKRAFYISGQYTVNLSDARIQNCTMNNDGGGAIYNYGKLTIINCTFTNNTSNYWGGAIYNYNGNLTIINTKFNNNTANYGGAINARNGVININSTTFNQNNATNSGGAVYVALSDIILNMRNSSFQDNTATNYANIYSGDEITVYDCNINDISTTCYNITNKNYLTDHQSLSNYIQKSNTSGLIKNDGTIDTTTKLTSSDIINDLTTGGTTKALSAEQGKELADMIGNAITYINS